MSYPKKDKKEDFRLQFEKWEREQEEKKRKAWEDFEKLSSQAKIEHLWKHIYELEQNIQLLEDELDVHQRCTAAPEKPEEWIVDVDSRAEELEKLASLRYFGPIDWECPECHHRSVIRERSHESPTEEYILQCLSCGRREERKFPTDY